MLHRRAFVSATALLGATAASRALALSIEEPSEAMRQAISARCTAADDHRLLLAEAETMMQGRALEPSQREALLKTVTCPLCGCRPADPDAAR